MAKFERSSRSDQDDWRGRVTTAVWVAACIAGALLSGPRVGIDGFWPGMLAIVVSILVGIVLGRFTGSLLFRPSSGGPPDSPAAG